MIAKNYEIKYNEVNGKLLSNNNNTILEFEEELGKYISTKEVYVVPVSSCSHALKLLLLLNSYHKDESKIYKDIEVPDRTYLSVYLNMNRPKINTNEEYNKWHGYYQIKNTNIFDSAQCLKRNLFDEIERIETNPFVCLSFGHKKPLDIKKGGAIVFLKSNTNKEIYHILKRMSHDGRDSSVSIFEDTLLTDLKGNIIGEHFNFVPRQAEMALGELGNLIIMEKINPTSYYVGYSNYPSLTEILKGKINEHK